MKRIKIHPEIFEGLKIVFQDHYEEVMQMAKKIELGGLEDIEIERRESGKAIKIKPDESVDTVEIDDTEEEKHEAQTMGSVVFDNKGRVFGIIKAGKSMENKEDPFKQGLKSFIWDIAPYLTEQQLAGKAEELQKIINSRP